METVPSWVSSLLKHIFFEPCEKHRELSDSKLRLYCIDCDIAFCMHCLFPSSSAASSSSSSSEEERGHCIIQIRRYVYHDVIRVQDMRKFVDCSKIQSFIVNGEKVIFLNPKEKPENQAGRRGRGAHPCMRCERTLPEANHYCSIACKIGCSQQPVKEASPEKPSPAVVPLKRGAQRRKGVPRRAPFF